MPLTAGDAISPVPPVVENKAGERRREGQGGRKKTRWENYGFALVSYPSYVVEGDDLRTLTAILE